MRYRIFLLLSVIIVCASCVKNEEVQLCSLYGTVNDKATGDAIINVNVEIVESGTSVTTGDDGVFEFHSLKEGTYTLKFTKTGYNDLTKDNIVVKSGDNNKPVFVLMEKLPPSFSIVDESENEMNEINFGYEPDDNVRTFNIKNNGADKFEWSIDTTNTAQWIKTIAPSSGVLHPRTTQSVVVVIDRSLLKEGQNETTIHIVPKENNVSKQVKVTAVQYSSPEIYLDNPNPEKISYQSATLEGRVIYAGFPEYKIFGFVISEDINPSLENTLRKITRTKEEMDNEKGKFEYTVENLLDNRMYFVRAYAIRDIDTTYSDVKSFVTRIKKVPKLKDIEKESDAGLIVTFKSVIEDDGGTEITEKGVCWSTKQMPTLEVYDNSVEKTVDGRGNQSFSSVVDKFSPDVTYYVRSYAKNSDGYGYSDNQIEIRLKNTSDLYAQVKIDNVRPVGSNGFNVKYTITDDAGVAIDEHGVCYGTNPNPSENKIPNNENAIVGKQYSVNINNVEPNVTYYFRAYTKNKTGQNYSGDADAIIIILPPTVSTGEYSNVTTNSAVCSGTVTSENGADVTERGICWGTNPKPTSANNYQPDVDGGKGPFSCALTGLSANTKYYYRAYAINVEGTSYGEDKSFTTNVAPILETYDAKDITYESAVLCGKVTNYSNVTLSEYGFYCANVKHVVNSINYNGEFSLPLTNLSANKSYSFYAYAKDKNGNEVKGASKSFTTLKAPTAPIVSNNGASCTTNSMTITGNITSDGGSEILECGVCYSADVNRPTIENASYQSTYVSSGKFSCTVYGLDSHTKYYFNVYARNAIGITYGIPKYATTKDDAYFINIYQPPTYSANNATIYGKIDADSDAEIVRYGVVYSTSNQSPSLEDNDKIQEVKGEPHSDIITFEAQQTSDNTMVYYRFYIVTPTKIMYSLPGNIIRY